MDRKLGFLALGLAVLALVGFFGGQIYVEHERREALAYQAKMDAEADAVKRQPPSTACDGGVVRVTDYSGVIPVSIPVWGNGDVVHCDQQGYMLNGARITVEEVEAHVKTTLAQQRMERDELVDRTGRSAEAGGIPSGSVVDIAAAVESICNEGPFQDATDKQKAELAGWCEKQLGGKHD